jgi:2,3-bisphosphoglycerate-dependent phosphoglycerate mutase
MTSVSDAPVTTLLWIRHGEADSNRDGRFGGHSPAPLTELGVRQAAATARAVKRFEPTVLISSDLMRARQTAAPIAEACSLELVLEPALRERSLGILDGLSFQEAEQQHPELWQRLRARDPDAIPEGGEAHTAVYARVAGAIDRAVAAHPGGRIAMVSHGLALYHAFSHVCGLGAPGPDHNVFVLVDNCSLSRLEHRTSGDGRPRWRIVTLNDTGHLAQGDGA